MIGAVVVAAGVSSRMGQPKQVLPWGSTTIVRHIVDVLVQGEASPVIVVTGGARGRVVAALRGSPAVAVHNPEFRGGEMLSSIHVGIRSLPRECAAALIALGDQPQIRVDTVREVVEGYRRGGAAIVCPSYRMRRGHPLLIAKPMFEPLLRMSPPRTLRDFLNEHAAAIRYVEVEDVSVVRDIDTPEEYERARPEE